MKKRNEFHLNLLDVLLMFVAASGVCLFISRDLFLFVGGFTAILFCMWLVMVWDDIAIWWSTRK